MVSWERDKSIPRDLMDLLHAIEVNTGSWRCSCGAGGEGQTQQDAVGAAQDHGKRVRLAAPYELPIGARSAQEVYTQMVREGLRPLLRALGFKGSGPSFTWSSDTQFAQVSLQKSTFSTRAEVQFTANVSVVDRATWESACAMSPDLPRQPTASTIHRVQGSWGNRIGSFLPSPIDAWWSVSATGDWHPVADGVAQAVATFVLPAVRKGAMP